VKSQEVVTKLRLFFPAHQTAQILLREYSASLYLSQDAIHGKRFGRVDDILEEVKEWP
jgi:hypothetical protein